MLFFAIFVFVTFDVVYLNSVRLKHSDCSSHFLDINYRGLSLNFLRLAQLLIGGDVESNPGPTQNDCKSLHGRPEKIKVFKGTPKTFEFSKSSNVYVARSPKVQNVFLNTIQPLSLYNIKSWSVTCPSTLESLQKVKFEVNDDINSKVSLCHGDITKTNVDAIVNAANETLISGGGIYEAIHEAAGPELLHECQKLNGCETGDCKVTFGYKLRANYVFHTVRPRDKNYIKLKDCYKTCLQDILTYDVKSIAFCCIATGISEFDQKKAAEVALATVRPWLESNHSSVDLSFFVYMKMQTIKYTKI